MSLDVRKKRFYQTTLLVFYSMIHSITQKTTFIHSQNLIISSIHVKGSKPILELTPY